MSRRVIHMFKHEFAAKVEAGTKRTTIRPVRLVPVQPGDLLEHRKWEGRPYWSEQHILGQDVCTAVQTIEISATHRVTLDGRVLRMMEVELLAKEDGFEDGTDFIHWFAKEHGYPFKGVRISW